MEPATSLRLKPRPFRTLFAVLFMAVLTVLLSLLLPEEKTVGWLFAGFLVAVSALGTLLFAVNLLPGSSSLELTPAGMTVRSLYQNAFFAWVDIRGFFTEGTYLGRQVHWKFVESYRARDDARNLATRFTGFKAMLPDTYGRGADQLIALLDEWRLKAAPLPFTPPPQEQPLPANDTVEGKTMTIMLDPQSAQARHRRGVELTTADDLEEALTELEAAQRLNPLSCDIQLDKAVVLRSLGRFPEALEVCDAAMNVLVIPPATMVFFHQLRGDVLREQGQLQASLESFQRSMDLHPEPRQAVHAHHQKASLLAKLGRHPEALAACADALEHGGATVDTYLLQADILREQGKFREALLACEHALERDPRSPAAHEFQQRVQPIVQYQEGTALLDAGQPERALPLFEAAAQALPQFDEAFHRQGLALGLLGRHEEAVAAFNAALRINPTLDQAYTNRDAALFHLGRHEENIRFYEGFLAAHPDYAHGWYRLGLLFDSLGRSHEALSAFEQAARARPEMATYHLSRGIALDRCGRSEEALAALNEALRLNPDSANAQRSWRIVTEKLADQP